MNTFSILLCLMPVMGIVGAVLLAGLESNEIKRDW